MDKIKEQLSVETTKHTAVYYSTRESLLVSMVRDTFTFATLSLAVYVSNGSAWWTFFTGCLLLGFAYCKLINAVKKDRNVFDTKADLQKWVDTLSE